MQHHRASKLQARCLPYTLFCGFPATASPAAHRSSYVQQPARAAQHCRCLCTAAAAAHHDDFAEVKGARPEGVLLGALWRVAAASVVLRHAAAAATPKRVSAAGTRMLAHLGRRMRSCCSCPAGQIDDSSCAVDHMRADECHRTHHSMQPTLGHAALGQPGCAPPLSACPACHIHTNFHLARSAALLRVKTTASNLQSQVCMLLLLPPSSSSPWHADSAR